MKFARLYDQRSYAPRTKGERGAVFWLFLVEFCGSESRFEGRKSVRFPSVAVNTQTLKPVDSRSFSRPDF